MLRDLVFVETGQGQYGVLTEADALQHLQEKIGKVENLLALIHPENLRLLHANGLLRDAHRACTSAEIRRFQHLAQTHPIDSLDVLAELVTRCTRENSVLTARQHREPQQGFLILPP